MHSLRARIVALVAISVLSALALLVLAARRAARVEFAASIQAMRIAESPGPLPPLAAVQRRGGWPAVRDTLGVLGFLPPGSELLAVTPDGDILGDPGPEWEDARAEILRDGTLRLAAGSAERIRELLVRGVWAITDETGDTLALAFPAPAPERTEDPGVEAFGSAVDRRLWLAGGLILALSLIGAAVLSGRVVAPLRRLGDAAHRVGAGDLGTRVGTLGTRELDEVGEAFDRMADNLERSEEARRRMIRDAAHELRSPLTNLRGQVEALQDGLREPNEETLGSLEDEVLLLARLVDDLDELARAEARELELRIERLDLGREARRAADGFVQSGRIGAQRIEVAVAPDTIVLADPGRLGQILRNLVGNALDHGGPEVSVRLTGGPAGEKVELIVADDGPGIAAEHRPHVFERLYRVDASRSRATGGAGLGLAIVRELVTAQGGRVELESEPGSGTRVRITLPRG